MGVKFSKALVSGSDGTIVCDPRGGWMAEMGLVGSAYEDWTELRIGAFVSPTGTSDTNEAYSAETIASVGANDYWMFGLKDSDSTKLFNVAGTYFWGTAGVSGVQTDLATDGTFLTNTAGGNQFLSTFYCADGTTVNSDDTGTGVNSNETWWWPTSTEVQATTNFATMIGLQFIRANPNTSTQTVQIYKWDNLGTHNYTTTSESALRTLLNNFSSNRWATGPTITANTGAAAFSQPDYWYIRWPFINSRLRIHSAMYVVVSP